MPLYAGGAISTIYKLPALVPTPAKNESRKRPPIKTERLGAVEVTIVATQTPRQPMKIRKRRPSQSAVQMKNAPAIPPTWRC